MDVNNNMESECLKYCNRPLCLRGHARRPPVYSSTYLYYRVSVGVFPSLHIIHMVKFRKLGPVRDENN